MNLSLQQKLLLCLGIGLLVLALFIWLVVFSLLDKIKTASQDYLASQENLIRLEQKEALLNELEKDYQEKQADLSKIEGALLNSQEAVGFISTIERVAQEACDSFEIQSVTPFTPIGKGEKEAPFLSLRISLESDFSGLLRFLASLENTPYPPYRLIEIDSLAVRGLEKGGLETTVGLKIYTQ